MISRLKNATFRSRLLWSMWSGVLAGLPYCVRNIAAPVFPGTVTITPLCTALILATILTRVPATSRARRAISRLGFPATVLYVLVELYGMARGHGPLTNTNQVLLNDILSLVEFICAIVSVSAWTLAFEAYHARKNARGYATSFAAGFVYGAICHALTVSLAPDGSLSILSIAAASVTIALLSYHVCGNTQALSFVPSLAICGFLFFSTIRLLAQGGDPYYGMSTFEGSGAWYLAATATVFGIAIAELRGIRQRTVGAPGDRSVPARTLDGHDGTKMSSRTRIVHVSLICVALFLVMKCLAYIFPLPYGSFGAADLRLFMLSAILFALGALLFCAERPMGCPRLPEPEGYISESIQDLQMILIGLAISDFRSLLSLQGLIMALCFTVLLCASGAPRNQEAESDTELNVWLMHSVKSGVHAWRDLDSSTLLLLPAAILLRRCLSGMPNTHHLFDLSVFIMLCIGARTIWSEYRTLQQSVLRHKLEEADIAKACRNLGFGPLQTDVLIDTIHGYTIKEISARRNTTENTVKSYRRRAYRALGVSSATELKEHLISRP